VTTVGCKVAPEPSTSVDASVAADVTVDPGDAPAADVGKTDSGDGHSSQDTCSDNLDPCNGIDDDCDGETDEDGCDDGKLCTGDACKDGKCVHKPTVCDNGNPCEKGTCNPASGKCTYPPKAGPCDDGDACTKPDACKGGECVGKKIDCDDNEQCTKDWCDPKKGCQNKPDDTLPCDDGKPCTEKDACKNGKCVGVPKVCFKAGECEKICNVKTGVCAATNKPGPCDDGDECTKADACVQGKCAPGKPKDCDDGNPCTSNTCKGDCLNPHKEGTCDDGDACTGPDKCVAGACKGASKSCDDGEVCTADACDSKSGKCSNKPTNVPCTDGNNCTTADKCVSGTCKGTPLKCDNGDPCTWGSCHAGTSKCVQKHTNNACDDGDKCTKQDVCKAGKCGGSPTNCGDGNVCTKNGCDPKTGCTKVDLDVGSCDDDDKCTAGDKCLKGACAGIKPAGKCNDANPCTVDSCDAKAGCKNAPNSASCNDGDPCTKDDKCTASKCLGKADTATCSCKTNQDCAGQEDGDLCNGTLICVTFGTSKKCQVDKTTVVVCDKSSDSQCKNTQCAKKTGKCSLVARADGASCDADGSKCTHKDTCQAGACTKGKVLVCQDNEHCTDDHCDAKLACVHKPNAIGCNSDGNWCTLDKCAQGKCKSGPLKKCDDGNQCTVDSCDPQKGSCDFKPLVGAKCSDGNACTVGDICKAGQCVAGAAKSCDDKNVCTSDLCAASSGLCSHKPLKVGTPCGKSNLCFAPTEGAQIACVDKIVRKTVELKLVPAGTFYMGCSACDQVCDKKKWIGHATWEPVWKKVYRNEHPVVPFKMPAMFMATYETDTKQFETCVTNGVCNATPLGDGFNFKNASRKLHPINGVKHDNGEKFCKWLGGRLPTEAEWEYAARGSCEKLGKTGKACQDAMPQFPWAVTSWKSCIKQLEIDGKAFSANNPKIVKELNNYGVMQTSGTAVRGSKPLGVSVFGMLDMAGNVWELTSTPIAENEDGHCNACTGCKCADKTSCLCQVAAPPDAVSNENAYVAKGGSYNNAFKDCRASARNTYKAAEAELSQLKLRGFRCMIPVP